MKSQSVSHMYAVIVAGGSGTRLWPLSRQDLPKQIQKLVGEQTLIEDTVDRISQVVPHDHIFVSTTNNYAKKIRKILPNIPDANIIVEPIARGTTAAFALFSETICRRDKDAVIFSLASDHAVSGADLFRESIVSAFDFVDENPDKIALVGLEPDKPDTGLGYIKTDRKIQKLPVVFSVEKFVEKPSLKVAERYVEAGDYYWNAAYYCFKAKTLMDAYEDADPEILRAVRMFLSSGNSEDFERIPKKTHEIEFINVNKFPLVLIPARFKWSDIGNWSALHDLLAELEDDENMVVNSKQQHIDIDSSNCMVMIGDDKKLVVTVGLKNVVVVDTKDALLVLDKDHTQDIKSVLEVIKSRGLGSYL